MSAVQPSGTPPSSQELSRKVVSLPAAAARPFNPQRATLDEIYRIVKSLRQANLAGSHEGDSEAILLAKILYGMEMGLGIMQSIRFVYIIDGTPSLDASFVAATIDASKDYSYKIERLDDEGCNIAFYKDGKLKGYSEFTKKDAEKAELLGGPNRNYEKFPRNMYFSRAMTNGSSWHAPGLFGGRVYTPEEISRAVILDDDGRQVPAGTIAVSDVNENPTPESIKTFIITEQISPGRVRELLQSLGAARIRDLAASDPTGMRKLQDALSAEVRNRTEPPGKADTPPAAADSATAPAGAPSAKSRKYGTPVHLR